MSPSDFDRLAQTAYEAHRRANPGSLPSWDAAPASEQQAWRAAVSAITAAPEATLTEGAPVQSLILQAGEQTHVFHKEFTAGRQGSLVVNDDHASGHHALFQSAHGLWYVEDLGSTNGTWLNGRRVVTAQRLKKKDKVRIGRTTLVVLSA